jgi:hypothetical protein
MLNNSPLFVFLTAAARPFYISYNENKTILLHAEKNDYSYLHIFEKVIS